MTVSSKGATTSDQILYFEFDYFQLEGVPPFPSPYVTMDSTDRHWVDMADPNRSRYERYYRTQSSDPKEGYERIEIGTGTGVIMEQCEFYEGKDDCTHQPITHAMTFEEWLMNYASVANHYLDNKNNPGAIGGYEFKGIQKDEIWGDVYVFERKLTLTASDLYPNYPSVETLKFDIALKRTVEWRREIIDKGQTIVHALARLIKWETINGSQIPNDLFSLRQP